MNEFYLMYNDNGVIKKVFDKSFEDISDIDLQTIFYNKTEFIKKIKEQLAIDLQNKDILVCKKIFNKTNEEYEIRCYQPLFQPNNLFNEMRLSKILRIIKERNSQIKEGKKRILNDTSQFRSCIASLVDETINDSKLKYYLTDYPSKLNKYLKNELLEIYGSDYKWHLSKITSDLQHYHEFRIFLTEFISYYDKDVKSDLENSNNFLYDSTIFGYSNFFPISLYDANRDLNRQIDNIIDSEESSKINKVIQIKKEKFDDEEIGQVYARKGLKGVLKEFDANRIYSSTQKDLLRLGIISEENYINQYLNMKR